MTNSSKVLDRIGDTNTKGSQKGILPIKIYTANFLVHLK